MSVLAGGLRPEKTRSVSLTVVQGVLDAGDSSNNASIVRDLAISEGDVEVDAIRKSNRHLAVSAFRFIFCVASGEVLWHLEKTKGGPTA